MIVTLAGSNSFARQHELSELISIFLKEYGEIGLSRIDGEEAEYDEIRESLQSLSFLTAKKLIILRAPSANKQFVENAEVLLAELPQSTDVIVVEPKLDKRSSFYKYLQKNTDYHEYSEMDDQSLTTWLVQEVKNQNGNLSLNDATYLVHRVGPNQQLLHHELQKLLDHNPDITRKTIDLLTDATPQSTIFELLDAALTGNRPQLLKLYKEQRALKVEPQAIIALLAWQLHALAVVKAAGERNDSDIAKEAKLNPYVIRKTRGLASNINLVNLKKFINDLVELDTAIKTSVIDADDALQAYLLKLS